MEQNSKPVVLLTGALRGLGLKIGQMLQGRVHLHVSGRSPRAVARNILNDHGIQVDEIYNLDLTQDPRIFAESLHGIKPVDVWIHNASLYTDSRLAASSRDDVIAFGDFATNSVLMAKHLGGDLQKLIIIGSSAADPEFNEEAGGALYGIYKHAMLGLAQAVKREKQITTTVLNPCLIAEEAVGDLTYVTSAAVVAAVEEAVFTHQYDNAFVRVYK